MRAARIILLLILLLGLLACLVPVTPGARWLQARAQEVSAASSGSGYGVVRLLPVIAFVYFLLAAFLPRLRLLLPPSASGDGSGSGPGLGVVRTRSGWHWYEVVSRSRWQPANFFHCYGAAIVCAGIAFEVWCADTQWATHLPASFGFKLVGIGLVFLIVGCLEPGRAAKYRTIWLPERWWGRKRHPSRSEAESRRHRPEPAPARGGSRSRQASGPDA
jgi:hypothetical protein